MSQNQPSTSLGSKNMAQNPITAQQWRCTILRLRAQTEIAQEFLRDLKLDCVRDLRSCKSEDMHLTTLHTYVYYKVFLLMTSDSAFRALVPILIVWGCQTELRAIGLIN